MATRRRHNNVLRFNSYSRCYVVATWMFVIFMLLLLLFQATIAVHFSLPAFVAHDPKRLLSSWQTIAPGGSTDSIDSNNNNLPLTTITTTKEQENDTDDSDIMLIVDAFQKEIDVMVAKYRQSVQKTFESLQHDFQKQFAKKNTDNNKSSATLSTTEQLESNKLDWEYEKDLIKDDDSGKNMSPKINVVTEIGTITDNEIVDTSKEKQDDDDDVFVTNLPLAVNDDTTATTHAIDWFPIPKWFSVPFFDSVAKNNDSSMSLSSSSSMDASNEATDLDDPITEWKSFNETVVNDNQNITTSDCEEQKIHDASSMESNNNSEETTAIAWFTLPKWLSVPFLDTKNATTAATIINDNVHVKNELATVGINLTIITNNDSLSSNVIVSTTTQSVSDLIAVENLSTADTNHAPPSSSIVYDFYTNIGTSLSTTRNRFLSLFRGSKEEQAVVVHSSSSSNNSNQVILENDTVNDDELVARSLIEPPENTFGTTTTTTIKTNNKKRKTSIISKNKKKKTKTKRKSGTNMVVSSRMPTKVEGRRRLDDNEIVDILLPSSTATDEDDDLLSTLTTTTYVKPIKLKQKQVTSTATAFAALGNNKSSTNNMFLDTKQVLNTMLKGTTIRKEVRYVMKVILFTVLYFVLNITIQLLAKMIIMKIKK